MSVEASYAVRGRKEHHVDGASISVVISLRPEVLTLIAILASLLGLVLTLVLALASDVATSTAGAGNSAFYHQLYNTILNPPAIVAIIAAIVFFNVYEFTKSGRQAQGVTKLAECPVYWVPLRHSEPKNSSSSFRF